MPCVATGMHMQLDLTDDTGPDGLKSIASSLIEFSSLQNTYAELEALKVHAAVYMVSTCSPQVYEPPHVSAAVWALLFLTCVMQFAESMCVSDSLVKEQQPDCRWQQHI